MLLLIPYKIAGTSQRNEVRNVVHDKPWFEIGHLPPPLITVTKSLTRATVITITVCGMGK